MLFFYKINNLFGKICSVKKIVFNVTFFRYDYVTVMGNNEEFLYSFSLIENKFKKNSSKIFSFIKNVFIKLLF